MLNLVKVFYTLKYVTFVDEADLHSQVLGELVFQGKTVERVGTRQVSMTRVTDR